MDWLQHWLILFQTWVTPWATPSHFTPRHFTRGDSLPRDTLSRDSLPATLYPGTLYPGTLYPRHFIPGHFIPGHLTRDTLSPDTLSRETFPRETFPGVKCPTTDILWETHIPRPNHHAVHERQLPPHPRITFFNMCSYSLKTVTSNPGWSLHNITY